MPTIDESLLSKVASKLGEPPPAGQGTPGSILTMTAAQYSARTPDDDLTLPTGFDPEAAALFEAVVESAFLVANADGDFDETERAAFEHVVVAACGGSISEAQMRALLADLGDLVEEDGIEKRIKMVGLTIRTEEQARDVLRVAGLIARVSAGVSKVERQVLEGLAQEFGLEPGAVDEAMEAVERALAE